MTELICSETLATYAASSNALPRPTLDLFNPKSIAVVGASANPARFSGKIIPSMLRQGYAGAIYPINPTRDMICGLTCYKTLDSTPGSVDCVIYALAADHIDSTLDQCQGKGVKLLVVSSAGFAESGNVLDVERQAKLVERSHKLGIRVLGPNCIGFANFVNRACVSSAAALSWPDIPAGNIGLVSQSGGLGLATVLYSALSEGISYSHIITTGNEADLNTIDVARILLTDPSTDSIAMTIEAVKNPIDFQVFLAEAQAIRKPVIVLKSGRTALGKTMAASHTGALAGSSEVFESVCREHGAICATDVDDFYQLASMFARLRRAGKLETLRHPSSACSALSISGGHIGLFADHASLKGIAFPTFSEMTKRRISEQLGFSGNYTNPLDTTARTIGDDDFWRRCTDALLLDPSIEIVVPIITVANSYEQVAIDLQKLAEASPKAIIVIWAGGDFEGKAREIFNNSSIPVFTTPARASAAIRSLDDYCVASDRFRLKKKVRTEPHVASTALAEIEKALKQVMAAGRRSLSESESKILLKRLGFPVTREVSAASLDEALGAAQSIGYPLALKADHPEILHKSDEGLIHLGIQNDEALRIAHTKLVSDMKRIVHTPGRVLVQEYIEKGLELIIGVKRDAEFGPVVLLGLGGIHVETLQDVAVRVAPFDFDTARRMMDDLRCSILLNGQRGQKPVEKSELARLLVSIGELATQLGDLIEEVDINPLAMDSNRGHLIALDALITLRDSERCRHHSKHSDMEEEKYGS